MSAPAYVVVPVAGDAAQTQAQKNIEGAKSEHPRLKAAVEGFTDRTSRLGGSTIHQPGDKPAVSTCPPWRAGHPKKEPSGAQRPPEGNAR